MKLGIFSDLHMEFDPSNNGIPFTLEQQPDVFYICAGDIHSDTAKRNKFIEGFGDNLFYVLGNHDFYNNELDFFHQDTVKTKVVDGLTIAGTTLWTDLTDFVNWLAYDTNINDVHLIRGVNYASYNEMHNRQKEAIFASNADIIVTHHLPSYDSVHSSYEGEPLNAAFATELSARIMEMPKPPKLWIHGHTHFAFDYMIGETRVICHPRGYPSEDSYKDYTPLIIDLK